MRAPQVAPFGALFDIAIFHEGDRHFRRAGAKIKSHERLGVDQLPQLLGTGAGEQKYLNLTGNPQVILTTGSNRWEDGLDVVVEGEAVRVNDDEQLRRLAGAWKTKWDGQSWEFDVHDGNFHHSDGESVYVFSVKPAKVLAFGKAPFSHTRYVF